MSDEEFDWDQLGGEEEEEGDEENGDDGVEPEIHRISFLDPGFEEAYNRLHPPIIPDPIFELVHTGSLDEIQHYLQLHPDKLDFANVERNAYGGETPLYAAVEHGRMDVAEMLLEIGSQSLNVRTNWLCTIFHAAVKSGKIEMLQLILHWMPEEMRHQLIDAEAVFGISPLHEATSQGRIDMIELLIQSGSQGINEVSDNGSALHIAACKQDLDLVSVLIRLGADVNLIDESNETPLDASLNVEFVGDEFPDWNRAEWLKHRTRDWSEIIFLLRRHGATHRQVNDELTKLPPECQIALLEPLCEETILRFRGIVHFNQSLTSKLIRALSDEQE